MDYFCEKHALSTLQCSSRALYSYKTGSEAAGKVIESPGLNSAVTMYASAKIQSEMAGRAEWRV